MNFTQAVKTCFTHYFKSSGEAARATRSEYWYWHLFMLPTLVIARLLDTEILHIPFDNLTSIHPFAVVATLALAAPTISVTNRRIHDLNRNGWWFLIVLVPYIGALLFYAAMCIKGTEGYNDYGAEPV